MAQPQFPHGRGGAGNFGKERTVSGGAEDLVTPTLKQENYTTGRGGQGNIKKNDHGAEARTAQDVETPVSHLRQTDGESVHYGRGGAANVTKKGDSYEGVAREGETVGEKAKGLLEKIGLKKH
jgi:hypothetical protein